MVQVTSWYLLLNQFQFLGAFQVASGLVGVVHVLLLQHAVQESVGRPSAPGQMPGSPTVSQAALL